MKKICTGCKKEKLKTEFVKMAHARHSMCDPCRKEYQKKYNNKLKKLKKRNLINAW